MGLGLKDPLYEGKSKEDYLKIQVLKNLEEIYLSYISGQLDWLCWDVEIKSLINDVNIHVPEIEVPDGLPIKLEDVKCFTVNDSLGCLIFRSIKEE